jgi:large subunit ribosomal protein L21
MAYAIIETGGKQLKVEPGRFYDIELLHEEEKATISIDQVLLVSDGTTVTVGQPLVADAVVEGTIIEHRRDKKIIVYKMQPKKKTRKKRGHRQEVTRLMIDSISVNGATIAEAATTAEAVAS